MPAEPFLEGPHLGGEGVEAPLVELEGQEQGGLGGRRNLVPPLARERRLERHAIILQRSGPIQQFCP